jgi:lipid-A-disaccharide synthase
MRFVLVAGEASGDALGAGLIESLRQRYPHAQFFGVGGDLMVQAGLVQWFNSDELAVMGVFEVLRHLPRLLRRRAQVLRQTLDLKPTAFVGIDAPDFNLAIERRLKKIGVSTIHYVSPSIWAWRPERAKKIGQSADLVLCLFPFEPALYAQHGVRAEFVGHPLADQFPLEPAPNFARITLGLPLNSSILALLPGSRISEVRSLGKDFLDAAALIKKALPKLMVIAPMASARARSALEAQMKPEHSVLLIDGQAQLALQAADAVIVASGTAALEAALARKPMLVAYRLSRLTYWLARRFGLLKTQFFSLPNKLAERELVPELEQDGVTPEAIARIITPALTDGMSTELKTAYHDMHLSLRRNASLSAARAIQALLTPEDGVSEPGAANNGD